jgi:hypothetical protein
MCPLNGHMVQNGISLVRTADVVLPPKFLELYHIACVKSNIKSSLFQPIEKNFACAKMPLA